MSHPTLQQRRARERCRGKFLRIFPGGFRDDTYLEWERDYKWQTHRRWVDLLDEGTMTALLREGRHAEVAARAMQVEQRALYSMLFSFEKMALRDAVKSPGGARAFAEGLHRFLHGPGQIRARFEEWVTTIDGLPRKQTRVLTWPVVTVFGFIAQPTQHLFVKPRTMRAAAKAYAFDLDYASRPSWRTYASMLELAALVKRDLRDLKPRDMIDLQSFLWVQGSDEYA